MNRRPLSDEILRGLRWGAFLLAALAIGVAAYRLLREAPPKSISQPASEIPPPAQSPRIHATPAVDPAVAQRPVPGPPPVRRQ